MYRAVTMARRRRSKQMVNEIRTKQRNKFKFNLFYTVIILFMWLFV